MIARPKTWRMRVSGLLSPLICRQAWSRKVGSKLINNWIVMISGMPVNAPDRIYTPLLVYRLMIFCEILCGRLFWVIFSFDFEFGVFYWCPTMQASLDVFCTCSCHAPKMSALSHLFLGFGFRCCPFLLVLRVSFILSINHFHHPFVKGACARGMRRFLSSTLVPARFPQKTPQRKRRFWDPPKGLRWRW